MPQRSTRVPKLVPPTEQEFHALLMAGIARAAKKSGRGAVADAMDMSGRMLDKVYGGAMPAAKRQWDLLSVDEQALSDIAERYGKRIVDKDAVCSTDDIGLLLARLLAWFHEARHPDSPGGEEIVYSEKLVAEPLMREVHGEVGRFLEEIALLHRPRVVTL